jgi:hypothetical protein
MLKKEAEHLPRGIRPLRISVGAGRAAARPGMTGAVDDPLLEDRLAMGVGMQRTAVGPPAGYLTPLRRCRGLQSGGRGAACLGDDLIAVARVDGHILVAMEHDRRHDPPLFRSRRPAGRGLRAGGPALHGGEG